MAETKPPRNNAHCTLPDDPEQSTYRFIIVAAKRARQLQGGHRPVLPTSSKKSTVIAMEEARRGLVKYDIPADAVVPEEATTPDQIERPMRVILGVSGGIAAYKAAELARALIQNGHDVQAILTRAAEEFVRP